ncbi:MAG: GCN5-related N-acetyltransferase [Verrucomicrobiales bacterium]|nr:GCN5-related N-acetyltransferase [Verrucomicrobiales bacterium]
MPTPSASTPHVRELTPAEFPLILPLIEKHNATFPASELRSRLEKMTTRGYRCIGAFQNDRIVGVAGYWLITRFYSGDYMDVDNVVVDESLRSQGIGTALMEWLEKHAHHLGCRSVMLDSYVTLSRAHRFYFRHGYEILGYHFRKII